MTYNANLALAIATVLISAKNKTRRPVSRSSADISRGPIHPDNPNYPRIISTAEKVHTKKKTLDEIKVKMAASKDPELNRVAKHVRCINEITNRSDQQWGDYNAGEFTVLVLHRADKPMSENLILKRLKQNNVMMAVPRINILLAAMHLEGIVTYNPGKGYFLTKEMKALIEEAKPNVVDYVSNL